MEEAEFREFVRDCKLEFGRTLPSTEGLSARDAEIFEKDLDYVTHKIFATVFDPQQIVHLSREELLNRLGWRERFEYRNRHSFPVNEVLYQPIDESREALERALNELDGGYVGVLGTPGSGKSNFTDENYLATEVDYAIREKRKKGNKFAIVTLRYDKKVSVPALLDRYIYRDVENDLEGFRELVRALPIESGPVRWKAEVV